MRFFQQDLINGFVQLLGKSDLYLYNYQSISEMPKHKRYLLAALRACCLTSIGNDYLNHQNRNMKFEEYDLVIITDVDIRTSNVNLTKTIRGFIITQKGECTKFSDVHCINLICSQHSKGATLIALYLYCIYNNQIITTKKGLLELANSYYNVGGLCLYSKFGFEYDANLYGDNCFSDYNNLPMIVDIPSKYTDFNKQLKDILLGVSKGFQKPDICNIRGVRQQMLGLAMNVDLFLKLNQPTYIDNYILSDGTTLNYEYFYKKSMKNSRPNIANFIANIQTIPENVINEHFKNTIIPPDQDNSVELNDTRMTKRKRPIGGKSKRRRYKTNK